MDLAHLPLDLAGLLALAAGLGWASGLRLYTTLFVLGMAGRLGWVVLPSGLRLLEHPWVLGAAGLMLAVEFFADKIPLLDSVWDTVHTFIRIPAGAALAALVFGGQGLEWQVAMALLGGTLAAGTHFTKAGARAMIKDGLFEKFPCDEIYGLHNAPDLNHGEVAILPGPAMAGADFFDITINGYGAHGAMPNYSKDPVIIAMTLGQALQTIVSRNVNPHEPAVLSVTQIHAGSAYNVIPAEAKLCGTVRAFSDEVRVLIRERMRALCAGIASAFHVEISVDIRDGFSVLVNQEEQSNVIAEVARTVVDPAKVFTRSQPKMGSEDFADMLQAVPGAYFWLGHEGSVPVHNPGYVLDDKILPVGASMFARIIETRLPAGAHA